MRPIALGRAVAVTRYVLRRPRYRLLFIAAGVGYALAYMLAVGMILYNPNFDISTVAQIPYYALLGGRLSWLEPLFLAYPTKHLVIALPWSNTLPALGLGLLAGANIVLLVHGYRHRQSLARAAPMTLGAGVSSTFAVVCCGGPLLWTLAAALGIGAVSVLAKLSGWLTVASLGVMGYAWVSQTRRARIER